MSAVVNKINTLKALVVEDHSFQRDYVASCLGQIGVEYVVTANDGSLALECIDQLANEGSSFDLVISDLHMPNMDGVAFLKQLADRGFAGHLIILTALDSNLVSSVTSLIREYDLNFVGSLIKPVDTKKLIAFIAGMCHAEKEPEAPVAASGLSEDELVSALYDNRLVAHFQPRYTFSDKTISGFEALARLELEDGRIIPPNDFIYLYRKLGKAVEFEMQIYDQAFALSQKFLKHGQPIQLSVNICAHMLGNTDFYEQLTELTKKHGLPNDLITLEVTESSLIDDMALSIEFLARLRINGFNLAVDDFGTGYSSIKQLELLPFNELKIDRSFLNAIENDHQKQAIVQSTIELAKRLNLKTVAEGVETQAAWDLAKSYGCDVCQGYFTGKPMSAEMLEILIFS